MRVPPVIELPGSSTMMGALPPPLPPSVLQKDGKVPPVIRSQPGNTGTRSMLPPVPNDVLQKEMVSGCLASAIAALEAIRHEAKSYSRRGLLCLVVLAVVWVSFSASTALIERLFSSVKAQQIALLVDISVWAAFGITTLVFCCIYFSRSSEAKSRYRKAYKETVFPAAIRLLNPTFQYQANWGIPFQRFLDSRMFLHRIGRYWSEEYVRGVQGATAFEFANVRSGYDEVRLLQNENEYRPVFHGLYFVADFNKYFRTSVLVMPKSGEQPGLMSDLLEKWGWKHGGKIVHLEDPDFEREFTVHAEDEVEVRYLLTPALMRRILDIRRTQDGLVSLSFFQGKLHLALEGAENSFLAPEPEYSAYSIVPVQQFLEQVRGVVYLIDRLNLNTRIWSKG